MAKRPSYDWEAIEKEYRAGLISIREISRQYGPAAQTIIDRANRYGWTRDLSAAVRAAVKSKLADTDADTDSGNTDPTEIIEKAATRGVEVVLSHRKDIANLKALEQTLIEEIRDNPVKRYITQHRGEIVEKDVPLSPSERAVACQALAQTQHKRIALERQAFNLNDDPVGSLKELLARITPAAKQALLDALGVED